MITRTFPEGTCSKCGEPLRIVPCLNCRRRQNLGGVADE